MSFSSEAKAELCRQKIDKKSLAAAECYGVLLYCNTFSAREIRIITASGDFARRLPRLFKRAFDVSFDILPDLDGDGKRSLIINDEGKIARIFAHYGAEADSTLTHHVNLAALEDEGAPQAFIRGAFLSGGSVTDPDKRYHLELATAHHSVSRETYSVLLDLGLEPKETMRGASSLLYFKKADAIADFFTTIGASSTSMRILTAKVEREMRNTITRQVNCDSANVDKVISASQEQLAAIRRIARDQGLDSLPEPLKDAALLRIANPEASLSDLAKLSYPSVTKSCLSYRLKKLIALAQSEAEDD